MIEENDYEGPEPEWTLCNRCHAHVYSLSGALCDDCYDEQGALRDAIDFITDESQRTG